MASKKSSAVPNNPTAATVAPSDSRYLGRNFFQSSSPSPTRNTDPEAAATLRSIPRESAIFFWMRPPDSLLPSMVTCLFLASAKGALRLPALHHLCAVSIQRVVNNPLSRVDFVIVPEIQMAKSFGNGIQPGPFWLVPQRIVRIRAIHNFSKQHQGRITCQIVFLQNGLKRTFLSVVSKRHGGNIEWRRPQSLRLAHHLLGVDKIKFCRRVHKLPDHPGARHSIHFDVFTCNPFHVCPLPCLKGPEIFSRLAPEREA